MKGRARLMIVSSPKCWAKLLRCSTFSGPQTLEVGDTRCVSQDPKHLRKFHAVDIQDPKHWTEYHVVVFVGGVSRERLHAVYPLNGLARF